MLCQFSWAAIRSPLLPVYRVMVTTNSQQLCVVVLGPQKSVTEELGSWRRGGGSTLSSRTPTAESTRLCYQFRLFNSRHQTNRRRQRWRERESRGTTIYGVYICKCKRTKFTSKKKFFLKRKTKPANEMVQQVKVLASVLMTWIGFWPLSQGGHVQSEERTNSQVLSSDFHIYKLAQERNCMHIYTHTKCNKNIQLLYVYGCLACVSTSAPHTYLVLTEARKGPCGRELQRTVSCHRQAET